MKSAPTTGEDVVEIGTHGLRALSGVKSAEAVERDDGRVMSSA
jgi:hypothetical protein